MNSFWHAELAKTVRELRMVDDIKLDFASKDRDRLWKAREAIDTSNQDVLPGRDCPFQVRQHREPEV